MQVHIAPLTAAIAHGRRAREIPNPGLETEIPLGQCAHRADVHHVRGVRILERRTWKNPDLAVVSAIENAELAGLGDLVGKAHAAGAENATLLIQHHMRTERHGLMFLDLLLLESRIVEPEVEIEILQVALTGLITNRTIQRMVRQQKLQHGPPAFLSLGILSVHNHPFGHGRIASDLELGRLFDIHEADAAVARDRERRMIAVPWNKDPELLRGLDYSGSFGHANFAAVDGQLRHTAASLSFSFLSAFRPARIYSSNSSRNFVM